MENKKSNTIKRVSYIFIFILLYTSIYTFLLTDFGRVVIVDTKYTYNKIVGKDFRFNSLATVDTKDAIISSDYENILTYKSSTYTTGKATFSTTDPRVVALRKFLIDYNSPMYPNAQTFVSVADEVGLDWRLVASISGVESAFGKLIPGKVYNGWGWRGGPAGAYSEFKDWDEAITHITKRLALGYGTHLTPFDIEPAYCPPCYANPRHEWANAVTRYMNELKYYHDNLETISR